MSVELKDNGFTLIELMIAITISSIVMAGIVTSYHVQVKTKVTQEVIVEAQQNLRAAMQVMTREIRMAGYDPTNSGNFGITNVSNAPGTPAGRSRIEFTVDIDQDGTVDANETFAYNIYTSATIDLPLGRQIGTAAVQPLAQGIEALGLAYAYDSDEDGQLETFGGNTIWAVDTDADGELDANLDTDGNGVIDASDTAGGAAFTPHIPMSQIRAVQIWILARTSVTRPGYTDNLTYVVGPTRITSPNDKFRRRLMSTTVKCKNLGI